MAGRSSAHNTKSEGRLRAREPLAPRPTVGRHLRRIQRAAARRVAGDFTAGALGAPLDTLLRRLARRAASHRQTRNGAL